ncbi:MAG: hypothetical protein DME26_06400 [Verrucomicrobia bacterium]|nr:MAG: hypothetical protein DME26_06400 [Verrucomicrobiota bacterium]
MLLVNARVGQSSIHGLGLIAQQFIPKEISISRYEPDLDLALSQRELDALPEQARRAFRYYSFRHIHSGLYILSFDDDRFMNHSDNPNTNGRKALRDIAAGEELTYDYRKWDLDFVWKLASTPSSLAQSLEQKDPSVRLAVLRNLLKVGSEDKTLVPRIADSLRDTDRNIRYYAAKLLTRIGADAGMAVPSLGIALKDEDPEIRYYAAKCLSRIGTEASDAVTALIAALKDSDSRIRYYSAKALGKIGAEAIEAIEPLRTALKDSDPKVGDASTHALNRIDKARRST